MPRRASTTAATASVVISIVLATGCGTRREPFRSGTVDIDRTTTTTDEPCSVPETAERAVTEASLTAGRADAAAKRATNEQLARLRSTLPASLLDEVDVIAGAFEDAWAGADGTDPFDTTAYSVADQAIRRYVASGCTKPVR